MECEPLFAESDLEDESEVVEMEQETFISERTSYISPPYTMTLDTWQYQRQAPQTSDVSGPSTSSATSASHEDQTSDNSNNTRGSGGSDQFEPSENPPRICSPPFSSSGVIALKDPRLKDPRLRYGVVLSAEVHELSRHWLTCNGVSCLVCFCCCEDLCQFTDFRKL